MSTITEPYVYLKYPDLVYNKYSLKYPEEWKKYKESYRSTVEHVNKKTKYYADIYNTSAGKPKSKQTSRHIESFNMYNYWKLWANVTLSSMNIEIDDKVRNWIKEPLKGNKKELETIPINPYEDVFIHVSKYETL